MKTSKDGAVRAGILRKQLAARKAAERARLRAMITTSGARETEAIVSAAIDDVAGRDGVGRAELVAAIEKRGLKIAGPRESNDWLSNAIDSLPREGSTGLRDALLAKSGHASNLSRIMAMHLSSGGVPIGAPGWKRALVRRPRWYDK